MSKLVRIATPREIQHYVNSVTGGISPKEVRAALEEEGLHAGNMKHYLIHWEVLGHDFRHHDITRFKYHTNLVGEEPLAISVLIGDPCIAGEPRKHELRHMIEIYLDHQYFHAPRFAITQPREYRTVAKAFEDLGCRVERIERAG